MISLVLVAALCFEEGCVHMDVTRKFRIDSDVSCWSMAELLNKENIRNRKDPRFACLTPEAFSKTQKIEM